MSKAVLTLTAFVFFVWLLPLGIFIKPSQEKIACGGQRAICLCSHQQAKLKANPVEGYGFQNPSGVNKEANASGGGVHYHFAVYHPVRSALNSLSFENSAILAYRNPSLKSIEHIPKV